MTRVILALDHKSATLSKYAGKILEHKEVVSFRKTMSIYAESLPLDGILLPIGGRTTDLPTTYGARDFDLLNLDAGSLINELNRITTATDQQTAVKLGFDAIDPADTSEGITNLVSILQSTEFRPMEWILEPYFPISLPLEKRVQILNELRKIDRIKSFKLDLHNVKEHSKTYTNVCSPVGWHCRSNGLSFEEFYHRASHAMLHGCDGCIVGGALWKDSVRNTIIHKKVIKLDRLSIERRLLKIKSI